MEIKANLIRPLLLILLMNLPNLLLNVQILHLCQTRRVLTLRLSIITRRRLLPSRGFLFTDGLARHAVEDIATLARETFEVVSDVRGG
jgi:hypothetical protein